MLVRAIFFATINPVSLLSELAVNEFVEDVALMVEIDLFVVKLVDGGAHDVCVEGQGGYAVGDDIAEDADGVFGESYVLLGVESEIEALDLSGGYDIGEG